ncbi:MAG: hypothetical protein IJS28_08425 [Synergistaceae bacterium]|nr:hypothetical protein [Synergistaceae bacterium]
MNEAKRSSRSALNAGQKITVHVKFSTRIPLFMIPSTLSPTRYSLTSTSAQS